MTYSSVNRERGSLTRDATGAWLAVVLLLMLALGASGCHGEQPATGTSPSSTPSCVSDEMGRTPCPATSTGGAAPAGIESGEEENEREEYAEQRAECRQIFKEHGFYTFKFYSRYGDEDY